MCNRNRNCRLIAIAYVAIASFCGFCSFCSLATDAQASSRMGHTQPRPTIQADNSKQEGSSDGHADGQAKAQSRESEDLPKPPANTRLNSPLAPLEYSTTLPTGYANSAAATLSDAEIRRLREPDG